MAWPVDAVLIGAVVAGCWVSCAAAEVAWTQRSLPLAVLAVAVLASLGAEVGALNGSAVGGSLGGLGVVTLLLGGVALAALAVYLLSPPPERPEEPALPRLSGPAGNPDSEA